MLIYIYIHIIATINSAIQLHIGRLKGSGILCKSQRSCRHMIHGRVHHVGGNELTSGRFLLISIVHQVDIAYSNVIGNRIINNQLYIFITPNVS